MASGNQLKRKKTITLCLPSKRLSKEMEIAGSAKAVPCASKENPTPPKVAISENPTLAKATPLASGENHTPAEVAPSASNNEVTLVEVAPFASSQNSTLAEVARPAPSENPTPAPTCSEEPHFFSGLPYVDALLSLDDAPEATHSEIMHPCERSSNHANKPYHVCLECRSLATRHIASTIPRLMKLKFLPMCTECGNKMVERSATQGQRSGCRCGAEWLCCQCKIETYEFASAKREGEIEWRRDIKAWFDSEDSEWLCNFNGLNCICGKSLDFGKGLPKSTVYRCVGCEGIMDRRTR